ncbi:MAG: hypothetical protein AB7F64_07685 [Gammaproteobacteria bacterium]
MKFTIGELAGTLAFILAFTQLLRPLVILRLKSSRYKLTILILLTVGIGSVFINAFNVSTWLDIIAGLTIIGSSISLIVISFKSAHFTSCNANIFYKGAYEIIASGNKNDLAELAKEISDSIKMIFELCINNKKDDSFTDNAYNMLALFSDKSFCMAIAEHGHETTKIALSTVIKHLHVLKEQKSIVGKPFLTRLIHSLYRTPNSPLYRAEEHAPCDIFEEIKDLLCDVNFVINNYSPLSAWFLYNPTKIKPFQLKKYFEILGKSLNNYLKNNNDTTPIIFYSCLKDISNITMSKDLSDECALGIGSLINVVKQNNVMSTLDNTKDNIYSELSQGIFDILLSFSLDKDNFFYIHLILCEIYFNKIVQTKSLEKIRTALDDVFEEHIAYAFKIFTCRTLIASLIDSFGLIEPDKTEVKIWRFLMTQLKTHFIALHHKNPSKAKEMLPEDTHFSIENKTLVRILTNKPRLGEQEILLLN